MRTDIWKQTRFSFFSLFDVIGSQNIKEKYLTLEESTEPEGNILKKEKDLVEDIRRTLRERGYPKWIFKDFDKIRDNKVIRTLLDRAYTETAQRDYKNRHGVSHGLATAYNAIELYELVRRDVVKSDYMDIFGASKEEVLFTLMTSGLVHDSGRFYDDAIENHEEHVHDAIAVLERLLVGLDILSKSFPLVRTEMIKRVKELCLCHDKKLEPSGKVEIALMKLADALDTGPHRVYTEEDKPELKTSEETRLATIFKKDEKPGRYFGPLSIESKTINWNDSEKILEVTFRIKDFACADDIKKIINILNLCMNNGHHAVKTLAGKIYVFVETPDSNRHRIYPTGEDLAKIRTEQTHIPNARIPTVKYKLDILNMKGDTNVELPLHIKNVRNEEGIETQTAILGGDYPSKWEDIQMRWFVRKNSEWNELPQPEYQRTEKNGKNHVYRIRFEEKLAMGKTIRLKGKCRWNRYVNVMESVMAHIPATPTNRLEFDIRFPKPTAKFRIKAFLEVKNVEGKVILRTPLKLEKKRGRWALIWKASALELRHIYKVSWKFQQ